jgi:hypothetical protein
MLTSAGPRVVELKPGESAYFAINKNTCVERERARSGSITVGLPGGGILAATVQKSVDLSTCGRRDPGFALDITPFESSSREIYGD